MAVVSATLPRRGGAVSVVVSFRIDRRLKERMERLRHINWSEVVRRAIEEVVEREEALQSRGKDPARIRRAALRTEQLSRRSPTGWSSVEEIRRWRETRH